jgi:hypothetical protein
MPRQRQGTSGLLTHPAQVVSLKECESRRPLRRITRPRRLARPRTPPFHGDNTGSNPVGDANKTNDLRLISAVIRLDPVTLW